MEELAEALGIPMADTVAVGDSSNDLEMLQRAGTAIAMGNATQGIRDLADYVTTDVMEDGIWNALDWGCCSGGWDKHTIFCRNVNRNSLRNSASGGMIRTIWNTKGRKQIWTP